MSDILDAISRRKKAKADAHTSSDLEQFADIVDLMELCAQLEVEQGKIFAALPALKAEFGKEAKEECDRLTARAAAIENQIGTIASDLSNVSTATRAEFARLEAAIKAKGTELAEYSKRIEREIPAPVEAKIRALFEAMPVPKDGKAGEPGARGKDASLLTGFKGNWRDDVTYRAGEWFTFRGSSYLVLRDCKGQVPTKITQTGESAFYAVFAMSGAPGLPGSGSGGSGAGLPDQTGNAGKFLTTDGTDPSWATLAGGGDLLAANNLSDVASAATSFTNIKQAATEAASGVVELATSAETTAGLAVQASDTRLSNARTPTAHAATHVNGTDDIQNATAAQKGLATAAQITKLDGIEALADVTDAANVAAAGALMTASLGTGVATALAVNVGSAGAPVVQNGALGTPSSGALSGTTDYPVATTSRTGATPQATAPAAGLLSVLAIANGETVRTDKAIFDTTNPAALGSVGPGTQVIAARRDHVHAMPSAADVAALPTAGGTMSGDITLGENTGIALDPAGSADEKWSGITIAGTAGATLAVGDLCYLDVTATEWLLTDADAAATAGPVILGLCVLAANDGQATRLLLQGTMRSAAFPSSIALGAPVYVGLTAGDIAASETWGTGDIIRIVGYAITAEPNTIYFNPDCSFIEYTA